jgi:hypothetical protein
MSAEIIEEAQKSQSMQPQEYCGSKRIKTERTAIEGTKGAPDFFLMRLALFVAIYPSHLRLLGFPFCFLSSVLKY